MRLGAIRSMLPGVTLRTTVIAGFPGETEDDVAQLEAFIEDAGFDYTGVFPFSPEEGTRAAAMEGQIDFDERLARAQRIRDVADRVGFARAAARVGTSLEVLVEGIDEDGICYGRRRGQAPEVDGLVFLDRESPSGAIVTCKIVDAAGYDLEGELQ